MNKLLVVSLLWSVSTVVCAGVYKWVDENGRVHYGERPPTTATQTKPMNLKPSYISPAESRGQDSAKTSEQEQKKENDKQQQALHEAEQATAKKNKEIREHNCKVARTSLNVLTTGGRVFRTDDNGNRVYVSDEQRGGEIQDAREQVDEWCD